MNSGETPSGLNYQSAIVVTLEPKGLQELYLLLCPRKKEQLDIDALEPLLMDGYVDTWSGYYFLTGKGVRLLIALGVL